jgi:hypothetical protein
VTDGHEKWTLNVYRIRETRCGIGNALVMREPTVHERQDRMGRDKIGWDNLGGGRARKRKTGGQGGIEREVGKEEGTGHRGSFSASKSISISASSVWKKELDRVLESGALGDATPQGDETASPAGNPTSGCRGCKAERGLQPSDVVVACSVRRGGRAMEQPRSEIGEVAQQRNKRSRQ